MGNGSAFLISFLLAGFVCASVVEGADRCNFNASIPCFQNRIGDGMNVVRLLSFFGRDDFNSTCSNFDKLKVCVREKTKDCDQDANNPLKKIWMTMEDSLLHICGKNFEAFIENRVCLSRQALSSAAHTCETTDNMQRRYACGGYKEAVKCVNDAIYKHCGTANRDRMDHLVSNILSLVDIKHKCGQSSSGRRTEDSIVFRFILCITSFMLALFLD